MTIVEILLTGAAGAWTVACLIVWPAKVGEPLWELPAGWLPARFPVTATAAHRAHGPGSLADIAAVTFDTARGRSTGEAAHLADSLDTAYTMHTAWLEQQYFVLPPLDEALTVFRSSPVEAWIKANWGGACGTCAHCRAMVGENTREFRAIVARIEVEHTIEMPRLAGVS